MFRKIHSNRDPRDTLWSEVRREFGTYFNKATAQRDHWLSSYPRAAFAGMIALLLLSAGLSFTLFRHPAPNAKAAAAVPAAKARPSVADGFDRILTTGAALQQTLHLKSEVENLLGKGRLDQADSLALEKALDSLSQIHHQINHAP